MHKKIPKHQEAYNVTHNTLLSFIPMTGSLPWAPGDQQRDPPDNALPSRELIWAPEFEMWTYDYVTKMGYLKEDSIYCDILGNREFIA